MGKNPVSIWNLGGSIFDTLAELVSNSVHVFILLCLVTCRSGLWYFWLLELLSGLVYLELQRVEPDRYSIAVIPPVTTTNFNVFYRLCKLYANTDHKTVNPWLHNVSQISADWCQLPTPFYCGSPKYNLVQPLAFRSRFVSKFRPLLYNIISYVRLYDLCRQQRFVREHFWPSSIMKTLLMGSWM